jgi:arsenite methyltransferase
MAKRARTTRAKAIKQDRWSAFLTGKRSRGASEEELRQSDRWLNRLRDRVLRGARIRRGNTVVDVGGGTGLLALDARRRAGVDGHVIAVDISRPALRFAGRAGEEQEGELAPLSLVAGEATVLPLADQSANVVMTRSVLIYVEDKAAAAREMLRVLRPGGRVSLFEPINNAPKAYGRPDAPTKRPSHLPEELWEERRRIIDDMQSRALAADGNTAESAMIGFDERDLVQVFIEAGFEQVGLTYEVGYGRTAPNPKLTVARFERQPNPNMPSYADAARETLGSRAAAHMGELNEIQRSRGGEFFGAAAYLTAKRSRRK